MFRSRVARAGAAGESDVSGERRVGRGLGPFTSGHLTIIIVTVVVAIAFPFAAFAVAGSNVFVTDPTTGVRARVNGQHELETSVRDGTTGKAAKVGSEGRLWTTVTGTVGVSGGVTANVAPTNQFVEGGLTDVINASSKPLLTPPAGKALILTTVHVDWAGSTGGAYVVVHVGDPTTCNNPNLSLFFDLPDASDSTTRELTPGFIVPSGKALCAFEHNAGTASVGVFGYLVPASAVVAPSATGSPDARSRPTGP